MSVIGRGLSKRFAKAARPAIHSVDFNAPSGSITTLLGPSGSGKTTVLRIVAGLEIADAGNVSIVGEDVTAVPPERRGVGMVFQSYALFKHMNVADNIAFGLSVRKEPKDAIKARVNELLELVQLDGLGDRWPSQLSGGQRQRVALARALAIRPRVLLLDEPFGALDARVRIELRDFLRRLHDETHLTTLMVTHDQDEALELSHHVVVMNEGRVEQAGAPHDIYDHPATPFVAAFVGGANVLRGHVTDGRAEVGSFSVDLPTGATEGAAATAFVRPHDVKIAPVPDEGTAARSVTNDAPEVALAKIERLVRVGGMVKVTLKLPSDESMTVEMPKSEIDALSLSEGDRVMVDLRQAKVFVEDYAI
ncbi:MAG: ABC transporter ATP-binding protein [Deltaproteobacteria bacterium]|nr:ABC transporter ATP-binding protein [Deltaproteobacteria bacterium]